MVTVRVPSVIVAGMAGGGSSVVMGDGALGNEAVIIRLAHLASEIGVGILGMITDEDFNFWIPLKGLAGAQRDRAKVTH